jgi:hypothetical protein
LGGRAQVCEDREHPSVIVGGGQQLELREDVGDVCASTVFRATDNRSPIAWFDRPSAIKARTSRSEP